MKINFESLVTAAAWWNGYQLVYDIHRFSSGRWHCSTRIFPQ